MKAYQITEFSKPLEASTHTLEFVNGVPAALDKRTLAPVELIEQLENETGRLKSLPLYMLLI